MNFKKCITFLNATVVFQFIFQRERERERERDLILYNNFIIRE